MNNKHFKKRLVRAALTLLLALTTNVTAWATTSVTYRAYNVSTKKYETKTAASCTEMTSVTWTLGAEGSTTWYVANSNVTISDRIMACGTVHLILTDGATLTASKGITVHRGNTLNIYGQTAGTGALNAIGVKLGGGGSESAAIGGSGSATIGSIIIHGGHITADGASWSAGIGGGVNGGGGSVAIYGGTVNATGHDGTSEAIGCGSSGADVFRTIADGLCVKVNNYSTPVAYSNRVTYLDYQKIATVEPCTSHNFNNNVCTYCGLTFYSVTYNSNNAISGSVPASKTTFQSGTTVTVLGNTGNLKRTGYIFGGWNTKADGSGTDYAPGATFAISGSVTLYAKWSPILELTGNADNSSVINAAAADGKQHRVILADRTIYRDGTWNTLVLPFNLASLDGTPLEGLTVKTLESSTLINGELTLNFANANSIEAGKPYIVKWTENADLVIRTTADWNAFANSMGTESYEGKTVVLAADVTADYRVGVYQRFKGTFDGRGHTLTFNKTWYGQECIAPFCMAENATFRNLKVAGTINTSGKFAAGLISISYGDCTIENCQSSIVINSTIDGDGTHGGFIACCNTGGGTNTVSFVNCLFDGTLGGSNTTSCGGFVGWRNASLKFTNCLMAGAMSINQTNSSATFNRNGNSTLTNCYYKGSFGSITTQGTYTTDTGETLRVLLGNGWEVSGGNVVPKMNPNIVNPVFENVFISDATANVSTTYADFIGSYAPITDDGLLLDAHNPNGDAMHAAIRAKLKGYSVSCYTKPDTNYPATSIPFSADGNVTLWTICIPIDYSITYNLNGGTNHPGNPATYNIESTTITLQEPSKTKYIFGGWFYNEDCTGDAVTTIAHGSHGNVTLYAKWEVGQLELANNANNGDAIGLASGDGMYYDVTLSGRTFYRDGSWNTICLPFNVDNFTGTPLQEATVKTLERSYYNNGTLSMTFADVTSIEAGKPYIMKWDNADLVIRSASDWNTFASNVGNYAGKVVKLVADINVSSMVGGTFKGTLDGCGHTITINLSSGKTEQIALFNTLENATIQNLKIAGTITFGKHRPASIASYIGGSTTIKNCWSSVAIKSNYSSSDWVDGGAFVARVNSNATLNMSNCLFTGSITYHANNFQGGGMVGWTKSNAKVNLSHCLFAPSSLTMSKTDGSTYVFVSGDVRGNLSGCYYNSVANKISVLKKEGTYATATGDELLSLLGDGWEVRDGNVVPTMNLATDLIIRSASDWNAFVDNINNGIESYQDKKVKLAADITVTKMAGSSGRFMGTFDGCGHTLTFNYKTTAEKAAPFCYIDGATIKNLRVAGTIETSKKFAAGLAAYSYNNCVIESCQSSITIKATISGDGTHGGFIAYPQNGTVKFRNCLFNGELLGSSTKCNGGFVGWRPTNCSNIAYTNCLFAPAALTMSATSSCTFNRNGGNTFTNAYYTKIFGTEQGTAVGKMTTEDLAAALGDGWEVSDGNVVPKMISCIVNPVFTDVFIRDTLAPIETDYADFIGSYAPFRDDALLLDAHNPNGDAMHAALRINYKPVAIGHTFQGWCVDADRTTPVTTIPFAEDGSVTLYAQWSENAILLADTEDNAAMLEALDKSKTYNVTLVNRLIDTEWNTLALPFDVTAEQLEQTFGAEVRLFELAGSSLEDKVLGLSFKRAESIEAGKPYFIAAAEDVREPKFQGVTIDAEANVPTETDYVDFVPTLGATQIFGYGGSAEEPGSVWSVLILGGGNTLYNPASLENAWMRGYRGYFQIHDKEGNADESLAAQFRLMFDDSQEVSGIFQVKNEELRNKSCDFTYNLMGQKVNNPGKGLFIIKGKKVIVR